MVKTYTNGTKTSKIGYRAQRTPRFPSGVLRPWKAQFFCGIMTAKLPSERKQPREEWKAPQHAVCKRPAQKYPWTSSTVFSAQNIKSESDLHRITRQIEIWSKPHGKTNIQANVHTAPSWAYRAPGLRTCKSRSNYTQRSSLDSKKTLDRLIPSKTWTEQTRR